jgi:hypothetical protein
MKVPGKADESRKVDRNSEEDGIEDNLLELALQCRVGEG